MHDSRTHFFGREEKSKTNGKSQQREYIYSIEFSLLAY
jgi:hypothetical protein